MVDEKIEDKQAQELKKIYNPYHDKRKEIIKKTEFRVEDGFVDIVRKDSISLEQITKPDKFLANVM